MTKKKVPKRLWDFGLVYESELLSRMARGDDRRTGYEVVTGQTPDISEWLDFEFYELSIRHVSFISGFARVVHYSADEWLAAR